MKRRHFLMQAAGALLADWARARTPSAHGAREVSQIAMPPGNDPNTVTLFLGGDVMTGRGIDQILLRPSKPHLFEPYVRSALRYVELAERASGHIARPVAYDYVWGDALDELERVRPDARIINLETAVTTSEDAWPGKGIHYRMHPANVPCLTVARLDCCVVANNHVMDWGRTGLAETLTTLRGAGLKIAGAGSDLREAAAPAVIELPPRGRILVFGVGMANAGVPAAWAAAERRSGVNLLPDGSPRSVEAIARLVSAYKRRGDIAVMSMHWGNNWGYEISPNERALAHDLIDRAEVDAVHGHSSHHVKGIEVYHDRPILYGCGDLLDDYEGIGGNETYRADLGLMYFPTFDIASGRLLRLALIPTRIQRLRTNRAWDDDARWLRATLNREGSKLGTRVEPQENRSLLLKWA